MSCPSLLPLLTVAADADLYHIGTLDPSRKGWRGESLEGHGLSVSLVPNAWQAIAKLGGEPVWAIRGTREAQIQLLDLYAAEQQGLLLDAIDWGIRQGLCAPRTLWRAWRYDSEWEAWTSMLCETEAEALDEATLYGDADDAPQGPDGSPGVEVCEILAGNEVMERRLGRSRLGVEDVTHYAAMLWIEHEVSEASGVWWSEAYAPEQLSAPRGALLPGRLAHLEMRPVDWSSIEDDPGSQALVAPASIDPMDWLRRSLEEVEHEVRRAALQRDEAIRTVHTRSLAKRVEHLRVAMEELADEALLDPERRRDTAWQVQAAHRMISKGGPAVHHALPPIRAAARGLRQCDAINTSAPDTTRAATITGPAP